MLKLKKLEIEGFGPFAGKQVLNFPEKPGVTVIYGENMRGKTSILNAIRYAFFGEVVGRNSRTRGVASLTNRELSNEGKYGFEVSLTFAYDGIEYELPRSCKAKISHPTRDVDYIETWMLRRENFTLGPQERIKEIQKIFPKEISRFFLFDGELLKEYEELIVKDSDAGYKISNAIERILGVPILQTARRHLLHLADEADKISAKEASKHKESEALGNLLTSLTVQKDAHENEVKKLELRLKELLTQKEDIEHRLSAQEKHINIIKQRDDAQKDLEKVRNNLKNWAEVLQEHMAESWQIILGKALIETRQSLKETVDQQIKLQGSSFIKHSIEDGICVTCTQLISSDLAANLMISLPKTGKKQSSPEELASCVSQLRTVEKFSGSESLAPISLLWSKIKESTINQAILKEKISDLQIELVDSDPDEIAKSTRTVEQVSVKILAVKQGLDSEQRKVEENANSIKNVSSRLEKMALPDLVESQRKSKFIKDSAEIFTKSIKMYKDRLKSQVEATASKLFLKMTTEPVDYAGLTINTNYGLSIRHQDGREEEARSAGAEHVIALALMGALQHNAPLRGPVIMDSPFGRLDETHTDNVIAALPDMAEQVILLVYNSEANKEQMRTILGPKLLREYQLDRITSRRTAVREIR